MHDVLDDGVEVFVCAGEDARIQHKRYGNVELEREVLHVELLVEGGHARPLFLVIFVHWMLLFYFTICAH